jgi:hypothetical protein
VINKNDNAVTKPNWAMHIAHAAAMMAAFCFLMPLSGLIARHRWVFTPKNQVRFRPQGCYQGRLL